MMRRLFAFVLVAAVLTGCGKDDAPKVSKVVRKMECFQGGTLAYSLSYKYDKDGRLSEIVNNTTSARRSFFYSNESVTVLSENGASIIDLDGAGVPSKIVMEEGIVLCSYSAQGYLNQMDVNTGDGGYSLVAKAVKGNFEQLQDFDGKMLDLTYTQYANEYSIDMNNVPEIGDMFDFLSTLKIEGMYSGNLVKSVTTEDATYYFTYNFDSKERVSDMIVVSTASENSLTEHYKFTY